MQRPIELPQFRSSMPCERFVDNVDTAPLIAERQKCLLSSLSDDCSLLGLLSPYAVDAACSDPSLQRDARQVRLACRNSMMFARSVALEDRRGCSLDPIVHPMYIAMNSALRNAKCNLFPSVAYIILLWGGLTKLIATTRPLTTPAFRGLRNAPMGALVGIFPA